MAGPSIKMQVVGCSFPLNFLKEKNLYLCLSLSHLIETVMKTKQDHDILVWQLIPKHCFLQYVPKEQQQFLYEICWTGTKEVEYVLLFLQNWS